MHCSAWISRLSEIQINITPTYDWTTIACRIVGYTRKKERMKCVGESWRGNHPLNKRGTWNEEIRRQGRAGIGSRRSGGCEQFTLGCAQVIVSRCLAERGKQDCMTDNNQETFYFCLIKKRQTHTHTHVRKKCLIDTDKIVRVSH